MKVIYTLNWSVILDDIGIESQEICSA
jgi:hypothetical protein